MPRISLKAMRKLAGWNYGFMDRVLSSVSHKMKMVHITGILA